MLNLEALPVRIECFDISNLGEQATVASMVVFEQGIPKKADYRLFGIGHGQGQDDFASMAEAVRRRFTRLANAESADDGYDPGFAAVPNLVVIDGGKGQLSAALGALDGLDLPRVAAIGLAKRIEEVFVPGRIDPIVLPDDSPALLLLRRIRDEAHRFALKHHRRRRSKASGTDSLFERLPGRRPGPQAGAARALRVARRRARGERRRARVRARPAAQDGPRDPRLPEQDGRLRRRRDGAPLRRLRGARLGPRRGRVPRRRAGPPRAAARRRRAAAGGRRDAGAAGAGRPAAGVLRGRAPDLRATSTSGRRWRGPA